MNHLSELVGKSLPSEKFGAWIIDQVSSTIEGRSRLVSANLKHDKWVWTSKLVRMVQLYEEELAKARLEAPCQAGDNAKEKAL